MTLIGVLSFIIYSKNKTPQKKKTPRPGSLAALFAKPLTVTEKKLHQQGDTSPSTGFQPEPNPESEEAFLELLHGQRNANWMERNARRRSASAAETAAEGAGGRSLGMTT